MPLKREDVLEALAAVRDPDVARDVVSIGAVREAVVEGGRVRVLLAPAARDGGARERVRAEAELAIRARAKAMGATLERVEVSLEGGSGAPGGPGAPAGGGGQGSGIPGVARIIAVGAGKGGVGKSTIAVNLAVALARAGRAVGLMDGDIYGPSMPTLLGLDSHDATTVGSMLQPFYVHGVKSMTIGKLVEPDKPLIWRGPMAHGAFKQLVTQTEWGELDYLIIDLPPGTGDVSLTMAQMLSLTGAVLVCTPQKVAQDDCVRAAAMFAQLGVEVLGVVENMSSFLGDDGKEYDLFGRGGAQKMAQRLSLPFLGSVPISMNLRKNSDSGDPSANFDDHPSNAGLKSALESLARSLEGQAALASVRAGAGAPTLSVR